MELANQKLIDNYRDTYLCGHPMSDIVAKQLFSKLSYHTGDNFTFELAALGMMVCKDFDNSTLFQGYIRDEQYQKVRHAFVKVEHQGLLYALDISLGIVALIPAEKYYARTEFEEYWHCNLEDFWKREETEKLYNATKHQWTSNILAELSAYRPHGKDFGFSDINWMVYFKTPTFGRKFINIMSNEQLIDRSLVNELMVAYVA